MSVFDQVWRIDLISILSLSSASYHWSNPIFNDPELPKNNNFERNSLKYRSPVEIASFDTFKAKIGLFLLQNRINVWHSLRIVILVKFETKWLKIQFFEDFNDQSLLWRC